MRRRAARTAGRNFLGVFGHTTMDHIMDVPRFPEPNTSIEVVRHRTYHGGTGANIAFNAAKLGVPVALASFVGDDFPDDFRESLTDAGVDLTDLREVAGYTTPACWIMTDPGQNQVAVMNQGPMRDAARFAVAAHAVDSAEWVHICTGRPEYYAKVVNRARRKGKMVSFDPGQELHYVYTPETFGAMLDKSDVFFANESESRRALHYLGLRKVEDLLDRVGTLVLTKGKRGSRILTRKEDLDIPAVRPERFEDPTGAGDGFRSGFYAALSRGLGMETAGMAGATAASFIIEAKGCQTNPPTWSQLIARLRKNGMRIGRN